MEEPLSEAPITDDEVIAEEEKKKSLFPSWVKYVLAAAAVALVILYLFASGWGGYGVAYVKCGAAQPLITSTIDNAKIYYTPEHRRYSAPGEGTSFNGYFCTDGEAQKAGYLRAGP
jgi:hypothetical protein